MKLTADVEAINASNVAYIIPDDVVAELGSRRPKVVVTVNGHTWRSSIASMGGRFLLGLTKQQRADTGIEPGPAQPLEIVLDTEERTVKAPDDLAAALAEDDAAAQRWAGWSYTRRKEAAGQLTSAKKDETRARRLATILAELRG
ncbi:YdeI/OmpD-associated family protein [Nigerium massiliense]|uniref:YdeI/OmpD-associated family protein n=1 Tax=Nigerium massiliense TaxID=1522317 RepID=UPI000590D3E1|nr:YdeI/OmpD-associated family protein [Nigerium massiliense]